MALEALKAIKDLSKGEIIAKMQSGEFTPPTKGKDRDEFFAFVGMSKEEREAHLSGGQPSEAAPKEPLEAAPAADRAASEPPKVTERPVEPKEPQMPPAAPVEPAQAAPAPAKAEDGTPEPLWKQLGYENESKALEAHRKLLDTSARLQDQLDNVNAREGKRGQELKRLKEENDKLLKEMEGLKGSAPALQKPVRPKRPNPKEFEDGALDTRYHEALEQYEGALDTYEQNVEVFNREMVARELAKATKPASPATPTPDESEQTAWSKLWESDIPAFQQRFGLTTTVPVKRISDSFAAADPNNRNTTPAEKEVAKAFLESLPQADHEAYAKVRRAVEMTYDFSSGVPQSSYRSIEGALFDKGQLGDNSFVKPLPVSMKRADAEEARRRQQEKDAAAAKPVPAAAAAAADPNLSAPPSDVEDRDNYQILMREYNKALQKPQTRQAFEKSDKYREFVRLRQKLGLNSRVVAA
jgi:hypothetical protein